MVFVFARKSFLEVEIARDDYTASRQDLGFLMWNDIFSPIYGTLVIARRT
jgi:hypothetical protein